MASPSKCFHRREKLNQFRIVGDDWLGPQDRHRVFGSPGILLIGGQSGSLPDNSRQILPGFFDFFVAGHLG